MIRNVIGASARHRGAVLGIVLALALAVGLGSKELVSRSLDREASKAASQSMRDPVGHM